VNELFILDGLI